MLDLEHELATRNVALWFESLPPRTLHLASQQLPRWSELVSDGRVHAISLAAARAYRAR
jgi:hypothetical protein